MSYSRSIFPLGLAVLVLQFGAWGGPLPEADAAPVTVTDYIDPAQVLGAREKSHWMQPWRSYSDTVPATTLLNAVGINLNVRPEWAGSTTRLLAKSGFRRARIEFGWNSISYSNPKQMTTDSRRALASMLTAMKANGIRPLIVLNANSGGPSPVKAETITLTRPAGVGAKELHIAPAEVGKIVPGKTGIRSAGTAANYLFTSVVANGTVKLSAALGSLWASKPGQPTVSSLAAGPLEVESLLYEPFHPETLADGRANPAFEPTIRGWLSYVGVIAREAEAILGSEAFDVEVWNELSFGSRFLNINGYYDHPIDEGREWNLGAILGRTVAYIRDPANGVPNIGIGNGFSSESPGWSPEESPAGLTAQDKHPYGGWRTFPSEESVEGTRPLNGKGEPAGIPELLGRWRAQFVPSYEAFFPEMFLSAIPNQTLVRDLSPEPTWYAGAMHGRHVKTSDGGTLEHWITEVNLNPASGPSGYLLTPQDVRHIETKDVLRYLAAFVNKGMTAIDFYAANDGNFSLIDERFFDQLAADPKKYPGDALGGGTTDAVRRLTASMHGAASIADPRQLTLRELTDYAGNVQFEGDGTPSYPPLYNRDVFAFLPFQVNTHRFVIPVYVMTRNVAQVYRAGAPTSDPTRFDLPPERYRMAIGGVDGSEAVASATDPLTGQAIPVQVVSGSDEEIVVEMEATDSPRLLTIEEEPAAAEPFPEEPVPDPLPTLKPAPKSRSTPRSTSAEPRAPGLKPVIDIRARGAHNLLRTGHMSVFAKCDRPCAVTFSGRVQVGRRAFAMSPAEGGPLPASEGNEAGTRLVLDAGALRSARRALAAGATVRIRVAVSAASDSGDTGAVRGIRIRPPS